MLLDAHAGWTATVLRPALGPRLDISFFPFDPHEAAVITEADGTYQRSLRRFDLVRSEPGSREKFDAFGLAWVRALWVLDRRAPLKECGKVASMLALGLAWFTLLEPEVYSGDWSQVLAWDAETLAGIEATMAATALLRKSGLSLAEAAAEVERIGAGNGLGAMTKARWLASEIWQRRGFQTYRPKRFFVWLPDGSAGWFDSTEAVFDRPSWDPSLDGAVTIVDQQAMASAMIDRTERPLVSFDLASNPKESQ